MYLREFAGPDGMLPADFDGLVRDAFGDFCTPSARESAAFVQRAVALAGICCRRLIGARDHAARRRQRRATSLARLPVPGTKNGYYTATGSALRADRRPSRRTACGKPFPNNDRRGRPSRLAVRRAPLHPLPGTRVLTQVIDRGPNVPGRDFDITKALANRLGSPRHADDPVALRQIAASLRVGPTLFVALRIPM